MGDTLDGHAMARRLELRGENGRKEEEELLAAEEERSVNSKKQKDLPLNSLRWKEHGLRRDVKSGISKPTNGRKFG
jgi:hypothetical protein